MHMREGLQCRDGTKNVLFWNEQFLLAHIYDVI